MRRFRLAAPQALNAFLFVMLSLMIACGGDDEGAKARKPLAGLPIKDPSESNLDSCMAAMSTDDDALWERDEVGSEAIYLFLDNGEQAQVDAIMKDKWPVTRYDAVYLGPEISWTENPYEEKYWRFLFYQLRPTKNLLWAYRTHRDPVYKNKLICVLRSFVASGQESEFFWDKHTAAFRGLILANTYFKLKRLGVLPKDLDGELLLAIEQIGYFLEKEENFERGNNHGVNQAAALMVIGTNFTDYSKAKDWSELGTSRLNELFSAIIDEDGVLVEQSPYYHMYTLRLFWQINAWKDRSQALMPELYPTLLKMVRYAAYMVQPDGGIPLLGASITDNVRTFWLRLHKEMGQADPYFEYMRSAGKAGERPPEKSVLFPVAGQSIMRSAWGSSSVFLDQTQLIYDVGPYRTNHSDLDALSFQLYANQRVLLIDPGLYTYESGAKQKHYRSTAAHNTVVVNGTDQAKGTCTLGLFTQGSKWTYQSALHNLYAEAEHQRGVVLIDKDIVVVWDRLLGVPGANNVYEQVWRPFAGADVLHNGLTTYVKDEQGTTVLSIRQALPGGAAVSSVQGQASPLEGWFSPLYEVEMPAYSVKYKKTGKDAEFLTVIATGIYADAPLAVTPVIDGLKWSVSICAGDELFRANGDNRMQPGETIQVKIDPLGCAL
jgi:hypothetical protein